MEPAYLQLVSFFFILSTFFWLAWGMFMETQVDYPLGNFATKTTEKSLPLPPYYKIAKSFLRGRLFERYLQWCMKTEQQWNSSRRYDYIKSMKKLFGPLEAYDDRLKDANQELQNHIDRLYSLRDAATLAKDNLRKAKQEADNAKSLHDAGKALATADKYENTVQRISTAIETEIQLCTDKLSLLCIEPTSTRPPATGIHDLMGPYRYRESVVRRGSTASPGPK